MKISISWLREFLPNFSCETVSLVERLTFLGFEVEGVEESASLDRRIVVGRVLETEPHPNAERLTLCLVDVGREEPLRIVCGAPNVRAGMVVPVATEKAKLQFPDGQTLTIKPSKIRGERSQGMICAADELGLSNDHSGVMELESSWEIGKPFADYLESDVVLDIAVTPNRPDVLSHLGIARELADGAPLQYPSQQSLTYQPAGERIAINDAVACPYYTGVIIRGVTIRESPEWLRKRLQAIGLNPKNNIVDITNYMLHALGQPMHAFDCAKLAGERIAVRSDCQAEVVALNNLTYKVEGGMPVICDGSGAIAAIAGVMGGMASAVTESTTDIFLESALFHPSMVRRTAKKLALASDSSYRFERGVDSRMVQQASATAVALILELAGGTVECAMEQGSVAADLQLLALRPERTNKLLGTALSGEQMVELLERIGFRCVEQTTEQLLFAVPSFRVDVTAEIDLIEEVARLYGYNAIESSRQMATIYPTKRQHPAYFPDFLRGELITLGFREILTNPLIKRNDAALASEQLVDVLNPISEGLEVLRPSLLPGLLKVISHNIRHGNRDQKLFEVAHVFEAKPQVQQTQQPLEGYCEQERLVMAITGSRYLRRWNHPTDMVDFYDLSGAVEMLLEQLNILDKSVVNIYTPSALSIDVFLTEKGKRTTHRLGIMQPVNAAWLKHFDIEQEVYCAELDVALLERCYQPTSAYEPPSRFPVVERDISFIIPEGVSAQSLVELVQSSNPLIKTVTVFDRFERNHESGKECSIALSLTIADAKATLQDEKINDILATISRNAESKLGAVIRQV
uniref:Phenylalanine--tRNA ligase beta subunit n=1 Tax=Chlorobium chlorochromatii (strain CaD3) TaxID=340177 RepID=SYFB_CHLCH|nr:RecName: Full=Phenylalanine--tRNA ligase beta subunit; AltName: Full=Phenylalanyl-tRNA synthetase beta subunit; Short=PheRS [Chlorobium chlorochromatii CaD3]